MSSGYSFCKHKETSAMAMQGRLVITAVLLLTYVMQVQCAVDPNHGGHPKDGKKGVHHGFDYDNHRGRGPSHWGELPGASKCGKGHMQSPINLLVDTSKAKGKGPSIHLRKAVLSYKKDGHNYHLDCERSFGMCSKVIRNGSTYEMIQGHLHSASEHHIGGVTYPLEMHLVHKSNRGEFLVVGVLFKFGRYNPTLQQFIDAAAKKEMRVIDLTKFLSPTATLCAYEGSLTTPPCTEGVHWVVSTFIKEASLKQVGQYREIVGEHVNNRPLQPVEHRRIVCYPHRKTLYELLGM